MKRCATVLVLVATATATAAAQPPAPAPPPTTAAPAADPSAAQPGSPSTQLMPPGAVRPLPPRPVDSRERTGGWFAQLIVGSVGGFVGLWGGGIIGYGLECAAGCGGEFGGLGGAVAGAGLGVPTGATIGVAIAGDDGYEASSALVFLGSALGSIGGWYLASGMLEETAFGGTVVVGTASAVGGTLMYQLTRTRKPSANAVRVVPLGGKTVGLSVIGNL